MYCLCNYFFAHAVFGFLSESNLLVVLTVAPILVLALGVTPKSCPRSIAAFNDCLRMVCQGLTIG